MGETGDSGEGPWDRLEDAERYLAVETGHPAVVVPIPAGRQPYTTFRDVVNEARLFVEATTPSPLDAFVYQPDEQHAVNADGEYIEWDDESGEEF